MLPHGPCVRGRRTDEFSADTQNQGGFHLVGLTLQFWRDMVQHTDCGRDYIKCQRPRVKALHKGNCANMTSSTDDRP